MRRWVAYGAALVAVVATAAPGLSDRDSFPLSNYPMFSFDRGRVTAFDTAVGIDEVGETVRLEPVLIGGGYEVVHAAQTVAKAVRAGDAARLCDEIADRARTRSLTRIEVVTETYDSVRWFEGDEVPLARVVHASCGIDR